MKKSFQTHSIFFDDTSLVNIEVHRRQVRSRNTSDLAVYAFAHAQQLCYCAVNTIVDKNDRSLCITLIFPYDSHQHSGALLSGSPHTFFFF